MPSAFRPDAAKKAVFYEDLHRAQHGDDAAECILYFIWPIITENGFHSVADGMKIAVCLGDAEPTKSGKDGGSGHDEDGDGGDGGGGGCDSRGPAGRAVAGQARAGRRAVADQARAGGSGSGGLFHADQATHWAGSQPFKRGDTLGLLLDGGDGTLVIYKNGGRLGVAMAGLTGELYWAAATWKIPNLRKC